MACAPRSANSRERDSASRAPLITLCLPLLLLLTCGEFVAANPNGAPSSVCAAGANSQKPAQGDHGSASSAVAPFRITAPATWTAGTPVQITLAATDGGTFKGFMISAFAAADTTGGTRFGSWTATGAKAICTGGASTQTSATSRASVVFTWTPPAAGSGPLRIQATVVRSLSSWWALPSVRMEEAGAAPPPPPPPATPPPTTPPPTTPPPSTSTGSAPPPASPSPASSTGSASPSLPAGLRNPAQATFVVASAQIDQQEDTRAELSWEMPPSANDPPITSFTLEQNANDGRGWRQVQTIAVTADQRVAGTRMTATVGPLDKTERFDYRVRSVAAGPPLQTAPLSSAPMVTLRTVTLSSPLPSAPAAPTLTATDGAGIQATWTPYSGNVQLLSYEVRIETASGATSPSAVTRFVTGASAEFTGLALQVPHTIRVRVQTARGASPWSATSTMQLADACPGGCPPAPVPPPTMPPPTTPPPAVTGVQVPPLQPEVDSSTGSGQNDQAAGGETCPEECNQHGKCVVGKCLCDTGFLGAACERASSMGVGPQDELVPSAQTAGQGLACYGGGKFCFDYSFTTAADTDVCIRVRVLGRGYGGFLLYAPDGMTGGQGYYMYVDADDGDAVGLYNVESSGLSSPSFAEDAMQDVDLTRLVAFYHADSGYTEFTFYKDRARQPLLPLSESQLVDFSWAIGDTAGFGKHVAAGKLKFNFATGGVETVPPPDLAAMYVPALLAAGILLVCGVTLHWLRPLRQSQLGNILLQQRLKPLLPPWATKRGWAPVDFVHAITFDAMPAFADMLVVEGLVVLLYCAMMGAMLHIGRRVFAAVGQDGNAFAFGHMACVNITLVLLPISRNSIFTPLFGCSYERLVKFHRQVARPLLATVYVHFFAMLSLRGRMLLTSVDPIKFGSHARDGFFAMIAFSLVVAVGWEPIRRRWYALFRLVHIAVAPVAFIFAFLHSVHLRWYMIVPLCLWGLDQVYRLARPFFAYSVTVAEARLLSAGAGGGRVSHLKLRAQGFSHSFEPGSYAFLYLPSLSRVEWHPFSISSHPAAAGGSASCTSGDSAGPLLTFHCLDSGAPRAWTKRLADQLECASGNPSAIAAITKGMRIDGPYGRLAVDLHRYHTLVLVCGGVGCTPMLSLLQYLLMAVKDSTNYPRLRRVEFVWTCRSRVPFDTWAPELLAQAANHPSGQFGLHLFATAADRTGGGKQAAEGRGKSVDDDEKTARLEHVHVEAVAPSSPMARSLSPSPPPMPSSGWSVLSGRPNFHRLFTTILAGVGRDQPTLSAYDHMWSNEARAAQVAVLACGPQPMVEQAQEQAQQMCMHFHKETFAF